jgi:hypothetical protein
MRPGFACWTSPGLVATSAFGPHDVADTADWFTFMEWVLAEFPKPFDFLVDAQRLRLGDHDWKAFAAVMRWAMRNNARFDGVLRRWVGVTPSHVVGLAIAGSNRMLGAPFESLAASSVDEALTLVGHPDRATLVPWVASLPETVDGLLGLSARLQERLAHHPYERLDDAARALGIGKRTVQRLREQTTFRLRARRAPSDPT